MLGVAHGMDDSAGFAIELENRYKGIRAHTNSKAVFLLALRMRRGKRQRLWRNRSRRRLESLHLRQWRGKSKTRRTFGRTNR